MFIWPNVVLLYSKGNSIWEIRAETDFKRARKRIAELAKEAHILPGEYTTQQAEQTLNALRNAVLKELNARISSLNGESAIRYLIEQIEGVFNEESRSKMRAETAKEHEVEYDIGSRREVDHFNFIKAHSSLRFLIEKCVQLNPVGKTTLSDDEYKFLFGLVDWLLSLYSASDSIHYDVESITIVFNEDWVIEIKYPDEVDQKQHEFVKDEQSVRLGILGNQDDSLGWAGKELEVIDRLNPVMKADLGFSLTTLVGTLRLMRRWSGRSDVKVQDSPSFSATPEEIVAVTKQVFPEFPEDEIKALVEFLSLKTSDVLIVTDQSNAPDLPVWEYSKRPYRYNLRPLVPLNGKIWWGPYSVMFAGQLWSGALSHGYMPTKITAPNLEKLIADLKQELDDLLEVKSLEVVRRFTSHAEKNVEFYKNAFGWTKQKVI